MTTDNQKNPRDCKKREHLLAGFWASIAPSVRTVVERECVEITGVVMMSDIIGFMLIGGRVRCRFYSLEGK